MLCGELCSCDAFTGVSLLGPVYFCQNFSSGGGSYGSSSFYIKERSQGWVPGCHILPEQIKMAHHVQSRMTKGD